MNDQGRDFRDVEICIVLSFSANALRRPIFGHVFLLSRVRARSSLRARRYLPYDLAVSRTARASFCQNGNIIDITNVSSYFSFVKYIIFLLYLAQS